jgi:hypothetical protein
VVKKVKSLLDPKYVFDKKGLARVPECVLFARVYGGLTAVDWKTFIYLVNRIDSVDSRGGRRIPVEDALKFLGPGATVQGLNESLSHLGEVFVGFDYEEITGEKRIHFWQLLDFDKSRAIAGILYFEFTPTVEELLLLQPTRYGRLHLDVVRQLNTLAGVRLYGAMCAIRHATRHNEWVVPMVDDTAVGLIRFFGCPADIRPDNFLARVVKPAVLELRATKAFGDVTHVPLRAEGKGRPVNWVSFYAGNGDGYVRRVRQPRDNRSVDVFSG